MIAYWEHAKEGATATPDSLKQATKEMKRHRDVADVSFGWISAMMKTIVAEMRSGDDEVQRLGV